MLQAQAWVEIKEDRTTRLWLWEVDRLDIPLEVIILPAVYALGQSSLDDKFKYLTIYYYLRKGIEIISATFINTTSLMYLDSLPQRIVFRHGVANWNKRCRQYIEEARDYEARQIDLRVEL